MNDSSSQLRLDKEWKQMEVGSSPEDLGVYSGRKTVSEPTKLCLSAATGTRFSPLEPQLSSYYLKYSSHIHHCPHIIHQQPSSGCSRGLDGSFDQTWVRTEMESTWCNIIRFNWMHSVYTILNDFTAKTMKQKQQTLGFQIRKSMRKFRLICSIWATFSLSAQCLLSSNTLAFGGAQPRAAKINKGVNKTLHFFFMTTCWDEAQNQSSHDSVQP